MIPDRRRCGSPRTTRPGCIAVLCAAAMLCGCAGTARDRVMGGNADSVAIRFGGDVHATLPLAEKHCAAYERVPQLRDTDGDIVNYACIRR